VVLMVVRPLGGVEPLPLTIVRIGQTPMRQGVSCPAVWRIDSGLLSLDLVDAEGRTFFVDLVGPGDPLGVPEGAVAPWTATAWRPTRLVELRGADAAAAMAAQTARAASIASGFAWFGVAERILRRLHDLAERLGRPVPGGIHLPFALTQEELGVDGRGVSRVGQSSADDDDPRRRGRGSRAWALRRACAAASGAR
jgi:CRP-like cAMP-binding protein